MHLNRIEAPESVLAVWLELVVRVRAAQGVGLSLAVEHADHGLPEVGADPGQDLGVAVVAAGLHHRPRPLLRVGALESRLPDGKI